MRALVVAPGHQPVVRLSHALTSRSTVTPSPATECPRLKGARSRRLARYATRLSISARRQPRPVVGRHQRRVLRRASSRASSLSSRWSVPDASTICTEKVSSFRRTPRISRPSLVFTTITWGRAPGPPRPGAGCAPRPAPAMGTAGSRIFWRSAEAGLRPASKIRPGHAARRSPGDIPRIRPCRRTILRPPPGRRRPSRRPRSVELERLRMYEITCQT